FSAVLLLLFFHIPATTHIYTLSLHDALPISQTLAFPSPSRTAPPPAKRCRSGHLFPSLAPAPATCIETSQLSSLPQSPEPPVRRSEEHTSDSSHVEISYAVFCLKKKKKLINI